MVPLASRTSLDLRVIADNVVDALIIVDIILVPEWSCAILILRLYRPIDHSHLAK